MKKHDKRRQYQIDVVMTLAAIVAATLISLLIQHLGFTEVNIVVIYILSVLLVSRYSKSYFFGIGASLLAMLAFNFFFTQPLYTFSVDDNSYIFTFFIMLAAAIFTSALTSQLIRSNKLVTRQELQARILYQLANSLGQASSVSDVAEIVVQRLSDLLGWQTTCLIINQKLQTGDYFTVDPDNRKALKKQIDQMALTKLRDDCLIIPIKVRERAIAHVCLPKFSDSKDQDDTFLVDSIVMQITIAMERVVLAAEKETAKAETEHERLKSNLLRAISHDLRTPLTGITGAAEILLHQIEDDEMVRIIKGIHEDSRWLTRLVENILSLTKLQEGRLTLHLQNEAVEEIVAESINRVLKYAPDYKIATQLPDDVLFVPMDGKLIEQVLINLLDNAVKHSAPDNEILVRVQAGDERVLFEVQDHGSGIDEDELLNIFDLFYVADHGHTDSRRGLGLGLAICKAIVQYHGGEIEAFKNSDTGTTIRFYIKYKTEQ
ncbi:MAG: ATP-binding protein [Bacillota bacterium]|nr:ATP-binding protein [Bacillota bacterium]